MDRYDISIIPPADNDKKLNSVYTKLAAEIGKNAEQRRQAEIQWQPNNRKRGEAWGSRNIQEQAEGLRLVMENNKVEFALLDNEIPTIKTAIEYLEALQSSNQKELRVCNAKIDLAKEHVVNVFRKDFPAETWWVNEGVIEHYVNHHPIVLGAQAKYEELRQQSSTVETMKTATDSLERAENRRQQLANSLPALEKEAKELQQAVENQKADNAAKHAAQFEVQRKAEIANDEAVQEARFRIGSIANMFKKKPVQESIG